ncbi:hypothetical protein ACFWIB_39875, partial [Streptomyces sp. NPDC127051]|uniref:hypothetical protein n=1 Tax=Streptomyces sp. NPDC127051 TaxID=3347119 RepID=UPI003656F1F3
MGFEGAVVGDAGSGEGFAVEEVGVGGPSGVVGEPSGGDGEVASGGAELVAGALGAGAGLEDANSSSGVYEAGLENIGVSPNTSDLRVRGVWGLRWWVDRGCFVVRGDGHGC